MLNKHSQTSLIASSLSDTLAHMDLRGYLWLLAAILSANCRVASALWPPSWILAQNHKSFLHADEPSAGASAHSAHAQEPARAITAPLRSPQPPMALGEGQRTLRAQKEHTAKVRRVGSDTEEEIKR